MSTMATTYVEINKNNSWELYTEGRFEVDDYYKEVMMEAADGEEPYSNVPFYWQDYRVFGFIAGVRNYSDITPIKIPEKPEKPSFTIRKHLKRNWVDVWQTLTVEELLSVNYLKMVEDRRYCQQVDKNLFFGGVTCLPGQGEKMSLSDFLGYSFMKHLSQLKEICDKEGIEYKNLRVIWGFYD